MRMMMISWIPLPGRWANDPVNLGQGNFGPRQNIMGICDAGSAGCTAVHGTVEVSRAPRGQLQSSGPCQHSVGLCNTGPAGCTAVHHAGSQSVLLPRKVWELEFDFENPIWRSKWDSEEFTVKFTVDFTVRLTIDFNIYNIAPKNLS